MVEEPAMLEITQTKKCCTCKVKKNISEFNNNKNSKDGFLAYCKQCAKQRRLDNKEKISKYRDSISEKNKIYQKNYHPSYYQKNKNTLLRQNKEYRIKNKNRLSSYRKEFAKTEIGKAVQANTNHKRRIAIREGNVSSSEILKLKSSSFLCYWCLSLIKNERIHLDHFLPISKGGKHELSNLVISCPKCNQTKGSKMPHEFMAL